MFTLYLWACSWAQTDLQTRRRPPWPAIPQGYLPLAGNSLKQTVAPRVQMSSCRHFWIYQEALQKSSKLKQKLGRPLETLGEQITWILRRPSMVLRRALEPCAYGLPFVGFERRTSLWLSRRAAPRLRKRHESKEELPHFRYAVRAVAILKAGSDICKNSSLSKLSYAADTCASATPTCCHNGAPSSQTSASVHHEGPVEEVRTLASRHQATHP